MNLKKVEYENKKILLWEIGLVEDQEWVKNKQEKYKMKRIKYLKSKRKKKRFGIWRKMVKYNKKMRKN